MLKIRENHCRKKIIGVHSRLRKKRSVQGWD